MKKEADAAWDSGDYLRAEALYRQATAHNPVNFAAWNNLALLLEALDRPLEGMEALELGLKASPLNPDLSTNLALMRFESENLTEALRNHHNAISSDPQDQRHWLAYLKTLEHARIQAFDQDLADDLIRLFLREGLAYEKLSRVAQDLILARPLSVDDPLLLALMSKAICASAELESFIHQQLSQPEHWPFILAAFCQNYITGLYPEADRFFSAIQDCKARASQLENEVHRRILIGAIECLERPEGNFAPVGSRLDKAGAHAVKSRYEADPYPRWISMNEHAPMDVNDHLRELFPKRADVFNAPPAPRILIAGCGTGRQAIETALLYAGSKVLAIDLSAPSLRYASSMAKKFGAHNIEFLQMDLREISQREFDIIECVGVLHHLPSLDEALAPLRRTLAPGGFFKIGLYSKIARQRLWSIRARLLKNRPTYLKEDALKIRELLMKENSLDLPSEILESKDFFTISGFKNLFYAINECCYDLPEIAACLEKNHLEFLGFEGVSGDSFGNPATLMEWHQAEQQAPLTFAAMYQFWCRG